MTTARGPARVLIISRNSVTALSLSSYFRLHDVEAAVEESFEAAGEDCGAATIVAFPDDFPPGQGVDDVAALLRRVAAAQVIVVTRRTADFAGLAAQSPSRRFRVFPRAVWGWALLEEVMKSVRPAGTSFDSSSEP